MPNSYLPTQNRSAITVYDHKGHPVSRGNNFLREHQVKSHWVEFRPWRRRSRLSSSSERWEFASGTSGGGGRGARGGGSGAGFLAPRSLRLNDTSSVGMSGAAAADDCGACVLSLAPCSSFSPEIEPRGANCGGGGGKGGLARGIGGCDDDLGGMGAAGFFPGLGEGLGTELSGRNRN